PATWDATSSPDSIAAWALAGCRRAAKKQECYEQALVSTLKPAGVDKAMAALDRISAADADVARQGHVFAHGIGIAAYSGSSTVAETFAKCTPAYQSGCYHGVIQAFFADAGSGGATPERLNALCADYRNPASSWIQFQCAHGAGHGLMAVHGQHLLRALEGCDLLKDMRERSACWGGAFMENIVNATHPHHTATTQLGGKDEHAGHAPAARDEHAGHGAGQGEHAGHAMQHEPFKALDDDEPLYPCTVVQEQHRSSCYAMQTSAILYRNRGDFAAAAAQCERAPAEHQRICYISLGRDAAGHSLGDNARAIEMCGKAPAGKLPWCVIGTAKNRIDVTADAKDGLKYCLAVPGADAKSTCYRAVGEQTHALALSPADRERTCAAAETPFVEECRSGALLPRTNPGTR
ncbi:MAG: hypothetical protein ICV87_00990, partial [Gemmatimonadetes bacterium]|nr:hypothetical protein [Gemmatimonadota bacterium]